MQLGRCNIENPKDTHSEVIEGKTYVQVGKESAIYKEEIMRGILPTVTYTVYHTTYIDSQRLGRAIWC